MEEGMDEQRTDITTVLLYDERCCTGCFICKVTVVCYIAFDQTCVISMPASK
ncbi:hypothetical protein WUBG_05390 [Wuchereria bancrofti]|uniref:Uncharacterized protein n=1 Tax=Wuchereria bancrofti TaxID=6293 RepID=J9ENE2_WUCBA|nr:hypothetical protein WUBG_05390 [Wuchereria bancrofti]VDM22703.1 unnamed protein product [Wuchereria bancrofti]